MVLTFVDSKDAAKPQAALALEVGLNPDPSKSKGSGTQIQPLEKGGPPDEPKGGIQES